MTCPACNGLGRISLPNPSWTPATPREAAGAMAAHGRPTRACTACQGAGGEASNNTVERA